jgi:hypothetical protein
MTAVRTSNATATISGLQNKAWYAHPSVWLWRASLRRAADAIGHVMSDEDSLSCRPLYRSRSLPQLHTVGSYSEPLRRGVGGGTRLVAAEVRQLLTLKQHYYPEGGWGWVVVVVGMLVQLLSHGLHVASGVLVGEVVRRFGGGVVTPAGEYKGCGGSACFYLPSAFQFIFCFVPL